MIEFINDIPSFDLIYGFRIEEYGMHIRSLIGTKCFIE